MLRAWTILSKKSLIAKTIATAVLVNISTVYANADALEVNDLTTAALFQQQQNVTITGTVTDENNQPMPGVTVMVRGTSNGVVTNPTGKYSITVPGNATITISVLGYQPKEFAATAGPVIDAKLDPVQTQLDEVVVVGYGEQKKATLTGSIATVKGEEIAKNPSPNITANLQGKLPGLIVNQRTGEPGRDNPSFLIRGGGTTGDNGALIVIDGVASSSSRGDYLGRLNPEDIESISVLKDGSAAIYGNRAANGVILVTTKKGTKGKPQFSYTYNYGFQSPTKIPKMLDAATFAEVYNEGVFYRSNGASAPQYPADVIKALRDGSDPVRYPATDWVGLVLKPHAYQQRMNLQVTGGTDNSRYLLSFGSMSQDNLFRANPTFNKQYNMRANITVDISKYLTIGANINGIITNRTYSPVGTGTNFVNILQANPTLVGRYPNGLLGGGRLAENPLLLDQRGRSNENGFPITTTFTGTFKFPWVEGLKFDVSFNYDVNNRFSKSFSIPYSYYEYNTQTQTYNKITTTNSAELTDRYDYDRTILYNYRLTYDKNIGKHHINLMVGAEQQQNNNNFVSAYRKNFPSTNFPQISIGSPSAADRDNAGNAGRSAYNNAFGRASYDYKSKYIFDFNFRYDGSQIFAPGDRYGFFPSFQGAWRVSEESFIKDNFPFIDQLKVRATYGELGSDRVTAYQYAQYYTFGGNYVFGTSDVQGVNTAVYPNPSFTWEVSKKTDFGIEASLWKGLLGFDFTIFKERRSNILTQRNFSASRIFGFTSLPPENIGIVDNKGYELILSHRNKLGELFYSVSANVAYYRNKVVFADEVPNTYEYRNATGRPLGSSLLYQADGIFNTQAELDSYPHQSNQKVGDIKVLDVNGDGVINQNDQMRFDYNNTPKYTFGMNIDLQYKGFDMNVSLYAQTKAYNYDGAFASLGNQDFSNGSVYRAADRWTPSNPNGTMPRTDFYQPGNTTFFMNDATFIRLRSTELGYTIPKSVISKIKIASVRLFVSGFNLLTWSPKIKWSDPEVNGNFVGYPPNKIINLGANVKF